MNKVKEKNLIEVVTTISKNSQALSRYLANHPEQKEEIVELALEKPSRLPAALKKRYDEPFEAAIKDANIDKVLKLLRLYKYSALSALTFNYLAKRIETEEFSSLWSSVAAECVRYAYDAAYPATVKELGRPVAKDGNGNEIDLQFTVIALGKLGAGELNLSSDIDLMYIYNTDNGHIEGRPEKSLNVFASKLSVLITSLLSKITPDGFCHRVDTDLRPEGSHGPIANSADAMISFYDHWGGELERMMLIRARPVAGDEKLGTEFISMVQPFIYRKSLDLESFKKIKETKEKIKQEALKSAGRGINIKLGDGGIREVEFVVQSLQLIAGGKDPKMTTNSTFQALKEIKRGKYLPSRQTSELYDAYRFLRHMENMIQLPEEEQLHLMPRDVNGQEALAAMMGYGSREQLLADFDRHTDVVKHHFQHLFEINPDRYQMEDAILTNISSCKGDEEDVDSLPWFKKEETKKIQFEDLEKQLPPNEVSEKLSLVAEVIISEAYKIASKSLREHHGPPLSDAKGSAVASLAIIGMGKLGGREIDYASDLDLMFIYSDEGTTAGPKKITNQEYFTKLSQRIISLITLPTRYGRAYQIDADLRPSGRSGVLVTSLDSFKNYHFREAMTWEKQALLKARPIAGDPKYFDPVKRVIDEICYGTTLPPGFKDEIVGLRERMEREKAKESENKLNIKLGPGGLMDIETITQYMQLKHGKGKEGLRSNNTQRALEILSSQQLIDEDDARTLLKNYEFLRRLLSRIRLFSNHETGYLDIENKLIPQIAKSLGFDDEKQMIERFNSARGEIRKIYNKYMS